MASRTLQIRVARRYREASISSILQDLRGILGTRPFSDEDMNEEYHFFEVSRRLDKEAPYSAELILSQDPEVSGELDPLILDYVRGHVALFRRPQPNRLRPLWNLKTSLIGKVRDPELLSRMMVAFHHAGIPIPPFERVAIDVQLAFVAAAYGWKIPGLPSLESQIVDVLERFDGRFMYVDSLGWSRDRERGLNVVESPEVNGFQVRIVDKPGGEGDFPFEDPPGVDIYMGNKHRFLADQGYRFASSSRPLIRKAVRDLSKVLENIRGEIGDEPSSRWSDPRIELFLVHARLWLGKHIHDPIVLDYLTGHMRRSKSDIEAVWKKVIENKIEYHVTEHGLHTDRDWERQGHGISRAYWQGTATGKGRTPQQAMDNALDILEEYGDWDTSKIPNRLSDEDDAVFNAFLELEQAGLTEVEIDRRMEVMEIPTFRVSVDVRQPVPPRQIGRNYGIPY